jgi:hypothetical protein
MRNLFKITIACFVVSARLVFAQDGAAHTEGTFPTPKAVESRGENRIHMGLNAGLTVPDGSYDTTPGLGLDVGFQPYIPFGVGAELFTSEIDADKGGNDQRTALLGRGSYNFGGELPLIRHSFVGLGAGPVVTGGIWELGIAPMTGLDIPVTKINGRDLTLGANAKYLVITSGTPDAFMANLAVKYWY